MVLVANFDNDAKTLENDQNPGTKSDSTHWELSD